MVGVQVSSFPAKAFTMTKAACLDTFLVRKRNLKNDYFSATFAPFSLARHSRPGQFVHLQLPSADIYFRRALSIASVNPDDNEIELIFKVFGRGTRSLSKLRPGDPANLMGPLGKPFELPRKNLTTVMVAGGIGFPPLLFAAETMVKNGRDPAAIEFFYGGQSAADIVERNRLKKMGLRFHPATDDGSIGTKGLITEPVEAFLAQNKARQLRILACGPEGMLKAVDQLGLKYKVQGQLSLEAPMPCGLGICLGCVVELTDGSHARVCREGPVFNIGEVKL